MSEGTEGAAAPVEAAPVAAEGTDAAALAAAAAAPAEAPAPPAPEPASVDLETDADDGVYSDPEKARAYAKQLREEAARNRVKAKEAAASFDGWTPEDADVLRTVIAEAAADPKVGAEKMRQIADLLDGGKVEEAAAAAVEATAEAKALTAEDVDAKVKEALDAKDREQALSVRTNEIVAQAKEWGYDPASVDYFSLIHLATHETGGDLEKAHEAMQARKQSVIDEYVQGVRDRAAGMPIHAPRGDDAVVEPQGEVKTFADARSRTEARLVALRKGGRQ